jgi:high-affinity nickel permease
LGKHAFFRLRRCFFPLGHSTVVVLASIAIVLAATAVQQDFLMNGPAPTAGAVW